MDALLSTHFFCGYWEVGIPYTVLTTPVWWLSLLQLTVLIRSAIVVFTIEVFGGIFLLSFCFLEFSVDVRAFVIGLSQISSFFS